MKQQSSKPKVFTKQAGNSLEEETKFMEERLEMVKRMMELEKDKRSQKMATSIDGSSMWRSATTQKTIKGYSDMVLTHHRKVQPDLPPTTLILKDDTQSQTATSKMGKSSGSSFMMSASNSSLVNNTLMNKKNLSNQATLSSGVKQYSSGGTSMGGGDTPSSVSIGTQDTPSSTLPMSLQKNSVIGSSTSQKPPGNAANNLMKALKQQNDQTAPLHAEVDIFLDSVGGPQIISKYKDVFIDNGIEDLETILEMDDKHLEQLSVPMGHKLKIMKRIKEIRTERGMYVPPSRQGEKRPPVAAKPILKVEEEPNTASGGVGTENDEKSGTSQGIGNSLLDGEYDEEEQQKQFQAALAAWRNQGKPKEESSEDASSKAKGEKKVRFAGEEDDEERKDNVIASPKKEAPKKSFFMLGDDQEDLLWNVVSLPQFEERGIGENKPLPGPIKRQSCWHCLKFYIQGTGVEFEHPDITTKQFCGPACRAAFLKIEMQPCPHCKKPFLKMTSEFVKQGKWYCSEGCLTGQTRIGIQIAQPSGAAKAVPQKQINLSMWTVNDNKAAKFEESAQDDSWEDYDLNEDNFEL